MNIENLTDKVSEGDVFSTVNGLIKQLGLKTVKGKQRELQLKEISRYLEYQKTNKISRGKITNEIVVTEIYNFPREKEDNRKNNGSNGNSKYIEILKPLILTASIENDMYTIPMLMKYLGLIFTVYDIKRSLEDSKVVRKYKYNYEYEFIKKVESTCKSLKKEYDFFDYRFTYLLEGEYIADDEKLEEINIKLKEARTETVDYFKEEYNIKKLKFFQVLNNENMLNYYLSVREKKLLDIDIVKMQKIFTFTNSNKSFNLIDLSDVFGIDVLLDCEKDLKELFRKRMLKLIPKIDNYLDELCDLQEIHDFLFCTYKDYTLNELITDSDPEFEQFFELWKQEKEPDETDEFVDLVFPKKKDCNINKNLLPNLFKNDLDKSSVIVKEIVKNDIPSWDDIIDNLY